MGLEWVTLKNKSTEMIRFIAKTTNYQVPIIGVGGIMSANDAIEKIEAGES